MENINFSPPTFWLHNTVSTAFSFSNVNIRISTNQQTDFDLAGFEKLG